MTTMHLSEEDVELVMRHRAKQVEVSAKQKQQAECNHDWLYRGSYRGEDGYQCRHCNLMKWED